MRKTATAPRLVLLVTAAVFINYIDRGNLATAPPLRKVPTKAQGDGRRFTVSIGRAAR